MIELPTIPKSDPRFDVIQELGALMLGLHANLSGSSMITAKGRDKDVFVSSERVHGRASERLLNAGAVPLDEEEEHKMYVVDMWGNKFHTLSAKYEWHGEAINIVYKQVGRSPLRTGEVQTASFDFGVLGQWVDFRTGKYHDARPSRFPGMDPLVLPLMEGREMDWMHGIVNQYQAPRQASRYVTYVEDYEVDNSLFKPQIIEGYEVAAKRHLSKGSERWQLLGQTCALLADHIRNDEFTIIRTALQQLEFDDSMAIVVEALDR